MSADERFVVMANGEQIGQVTATVTGSDIEVDYTVNDNGRGAKHRERIRLDEQLLPVHWRIEGTSLMGGQVDEVLSVDGDRLTWTCQADEGQAPAGAGRLYVANDVSPYAFGIYARAALAAGGSIDLLPSGRLRTQLLRHVDLGSGAAAIGLDAYALTGVGLTPELVLLDGDRRLFAKLGGGSLMVRELTVRSDHVNVADELTALDRELNRELVGQLQQRVRQRFDAPIRIRDVRVFDPFSGQLGEPSSVVVFRGRISVVEPGARSSASADEVDVDGAGGVLVAGLHDMHAHNSAWTGPFYLAAGVTTVRDMGNDNRKLLDLMPRLDAGELPGPSIVPSGFVEGRSPHSARHGFIPETLDEALDAVRWYARRGYHQIKIYNSMNPDWVEPLAAEARRLGMRTVGHVPAFATPDRVIEDGYDEVTHINQLMLGWLLDDGEDTRTPLRLTAMARAKDLDLDSDAVQHTVRLMEERGIGLDTTTVILERLMHSRAREVAEGDAPYLDHMPVAYQRYRKRTYVPIPEDGDLSAYDESFGKLLETMAMLRAHGVPLWPGTDDGTGFTVHRELELYAASGMSPAEVLRVATYDCAVHLGRGATHGSIERGKHADFLLLDGDPTEDISAIRRIRMVVKGGDLYFPRDIYRELAIEPFAEPPSVEVPREERG